MLTYSERGYPRPSPLSPTPGCSLRPHYLRQVAGANMSSATVGNCSEGLPGRTTARQPKRAHGHGMATWREVPRRFRTPSWKLVSGL